MLTLGQFTLSLGSGVHIGIGPLVIGGDTPPVPMIAQGALIGTSFGLFSFATDPTPPNLSGFTFAQGAAIGTNATRS